MAPEIRYVVYLPSTKRATPMSLLVEAGADVTALIKKIRNDDELKRHVESEDVYLYKCGALDVLPSGDTNCYQEAIKWLHTNKNEERIQMSNAMPLQHYFPSGPAAPSKSKIDVIVATESILESLDDVPDLAVSARKAANVQGVRSPSESASGVEALSGSATYGHLRIHRPARNYGPHTALFNHSFAKFKHRADRLDDDTAWKGGLDASPAMLGQCHDFITGMCDVFANEVARAAFLKSFFEKVLSDQVKYQTSLGVGLGSARVDATWGKEPPYEIFREDKVEKGIGGNAAVQGAVCYRVAVSLPEYKEYIKRSNCPAIIIAVMGTCIEIWTSVFIDGVFVDKLFSQELYLDAFQAKSVLRLGRICTALKQCYDELRIHYRTIDMEAAPTNEHLYPRPLPVESREPIPNLKYIGKLSHNGNCIPVVQEVDTAPEAERERPYAIYRAELFEKDIKVDVVVKFTTRYNEVAHKLLHEHGLAPALRYFARLFGDHYMVVTDYVASAPLSDCPKQKNYLEILGRIRGALLLLHDRGLVFGDLRPENIVLDPREGAKLIDFDFAGRHGVDRYPASFNTMILCEGVHRHGIMDKKHDITMLGRLEKLLEDANKA